LSNRVYHTCLKSPTTAVDVDELELEELSKNSISSTSNALGFLVKVSLLISFPKVIAIGSNEAAVGSLAIALPDTSVRFTLSVDTLCVIRKLRGLYPLAHVPIAYRSNTSVLPEGDALQTEALGIH